MKVLRTPEERFNFLPDYPFAPNYINVAENLRLHYLDEGIKSKNTILMMHGEPSWSYLYRHMIPVCVNAGHRVIAPDLIGFGKSDKPADINDYTYARHVLWITNFIKTLDLKNITLVCQDWGSLIGLRVAAENPDLFSAIVIGNGMLPTGQEKVPPAFKIWKTFALYSPWFPVGRIVSFGSKRKLSSDEIRAYDAPFPDSKFKAGARSFPALVPVTPDDPATQDNLAAWEVLKSWTKPFVTCFSTGDPITRGADRSMTKRIPGSKDMPHVRIKGGHFLQEDSPVEFAGKVNEVIGLLK